MNELRLGGTSPSLALSENCRKKGALKMKKLVMATAFALLASFGLSGVASAAPPVPVKNSPSHKAEAATVVGGGLTVVDPAHPRVGGGLVVVVDPLHPPVTLIVTDVELKLVLTNVGWVYVQVPVRYYVTAVWNPLYQAYGYYDKNRLYHLYYPPVVPAVLPARPLKSGQAAPQPAPVKVDPSK
jgi:hypothetical protein